MSAASPVNSVIPDDSASSSTAPQTNELVPTPSSIAGDKSGQHDAQLGASLDADSMQEIAADCESNAEDADAQAEVSTIPFCFDVSSIVSIAFGDNDNRVIGLHKACITEASGFLWASIKEHWGGSKRVIDCKHLLHDEFCVYTEWLYGSGGIDRLRRDEVSWTTAEVVSLMMFAKAVADMDFLSDLRDFFRTLPAEIIITMSGATMEELYLVNDEGLLAYVKDIFLSYGRKHGLKDMLEDLPTAFKDDLLADALERTAIDHYEAENNGGDYNEQNGW